MMALQTQNKGGYAMRSRILAGLLGASVVLGLAAHSAAVKAQQKPSDYPQRPITLIVPYGPGGGSDQVSRAMAAPLQRIVGQPIQAVNKPGAAGRAAVPDFMAAPADGYTLLQHIDDAITHFAAGNLRENPAEDWIPLAITQITFSQLYIRPDEKRFTDWPSLLKYIRANPGQVKIANVAGEGTMERVTMALVEKGLGIKVNQISYDNPSERYASLIGGHVDVLFEQPGDVRRFLEAKQMKPVLTFLRERPDAFKDVPSIKDLGVDIPELLRFRGFFARKGVPADRVQYLEWAMAQAYKTPEYQKFNKDQYMDVIESYRNRDGAIKLMRDTLAVYQRAYKDLGLVKK
jgi:tripartite-type tricarboxylate transporter receptor subunit TctC